MQRVASEKEPLWLVSSAFQHKLLHERDRRQVMLAHKLIHNAAQTGL